MCLALVSESLGFHFISDVLQHQSQRRFREGFCCFGFFFSAGMDQTHKYICTTLSDLDQSLTAGKNRIRDSTSRKWFINPICSSEVGVASCSSLFLQPRVVLLILSVPELFCSSWRLPPCLIVTGETCRTSIKPDTKLVWPFVEPFSECSSVHRGYSKHAGSNQSIVASHEDQQDGSKLTPHVQIRPGEGEVVDWGASVRLLFDQICCCNHL